MESLAGIVIIKLIGSLVFEDVLGVSGKVKEIFAEGRNKIIIDMSGIFHVNSKGIGVLISIKVASLFGDREFILLNLSPDVMKILTTTKLVDVFNIYEGNIDNAKKMFS